MISLSAISILLVPIITRRRQQLRYPVAEGDSPGREPAEGRGGGRGNVGATFRSPGRAEPPRPFPPPRRLRKGERSPPAPSLRHAQRTSKGEVAGLFTRCRQANPLPSAPSSGRHESAPSRRAARTVLPQS